MHYRVKFRYERFGLFGREWDVAKAWGIVSRWPDQGARLTSFSVKSVACMSCLIHRSYENVPDLTVPCILVTLQPLSYSAHLIPYPAPQEGYGYPLYLPIDGWGRIGKAIIQGLDALPCFILTDDESDSVRVGKSRARRRK